jgi:hypothetical protein
LEKHGCRWRWLAAWAALALAVGCATNKNVSLDPLGKTDSSATADPLRGRSPAPPPARGSGQARLMAPDVGGASTGVTPAGGLASSTLGSNTATLAANTRPLTDAAANSPSMDGSPFGSIKRKEVNQANWTASTGANWEQAKQMLHARGATNFHLEARDGQWLFRCSIPNPLDPTRTQTFEATAADDLSAVRQVLETIDRERKPSASSPQ